MINKKILSSCFALFAIFTLLGCSSPNRLNTGFTLSDYDSTYNESTYKINKIESLKNHKDFINAIDISMEDYIEELGGKYYRDNKEEVGFYTLLKERNFNAVRIRLFYDYTSPYGIKGAGKQDKERVLKMAKRAKDKGLKFILDLHYSDTWADPGNQKIPYAWRDLSFDVLKTAMREYTINTISYFKNNGVTIDYLQVGNEINNGMMWPAGQIVYYDSDYDKTEESLMNFTTLLKTGTKAVRDADPNIKIIIYTSNALENSDGTPYDGIYFFNLMKKYAVDYDIIASSYYAQWTNTKLNTITESINKLTSTFDKPFMLMEYSYGFTLKTHPYAENSFTDISSKTGYPVTIQGQTNYMVDLIKEVSDANNVIGTSYWAGEWIPLKGDGWGDETTKDGWANQTLFTYEGMELPSLRVFKEIY